MRVRETGAVLLSVQKEGITIAAVEVKLTQAGYGYIRGLFVAESYRQKGIATQLMRHVLCRYGHMRLELIASNTSKNVMGLERLADFYKKFGFEFGPSIYTDRPIRDSDMRRMYRNPDKKPLRRKIICVLLRFFQRVRFLIWTGSGMGQ